MATVVEDELKAEMIIVRVAQAQSQRRTNNNTD